jgi:hypothetical protein
LFGPTPETIRMSFATLAVIPLVAIVGPLLALPQRWHLPVTLGEESWPPGSCWGTTGSARLQARTRRLPGRKLDAGLAGGRLQVRQGPNIQLLPYPLVRSWLTLGSR